MGRNNIINKNGNLDLERLGENDEQLADMKNSMVSVLSFGAKNDGSEDVSQIVQDLLDQGYRRIYFPEGEFLFNSTILIHDKAGLWIEGAGYGSTIFKAGTDLQFDTTRIDPIENDLGTTLDGNYDKQCFFIVTMYDGEYDRVNKSARNLNLKGFTLDGSNYYRQIHGISSYGLALSKFIDIKGFGLNALFDLDSGNYQDGVNYLLTFDHARSVECIHHTKQNYDESQKTYVGTSWRLLENVIDKNKYGYVLKGLSYSVMVNCTLDNIEKGSYALDFYRMRNISVYNQGVETRYEKDGQTGFEDKGGGIFNLVYSSVTLEQGYFVGGDRTGIGTGDISDYGLTKSLMVISGDSRVYMNMPLFDVDIDTSGNEYPVYCDGTSSLIFNIGKNEYKNVEVYESSIAKISEKDNVEIKKGISNSSDPKIIGYSNIPSKVTKGEAIFSGDGSTTVFSIPHNLEEVPTFWSANPASWDAGEAGFHDVRSNSTALQVRFSTAPISGTDNVSITWKAEI